MGIATSYWEKKEGRDNDGDKFCVHILIDKDTKRIMGSVFVPTYGDAYSFGAHFDVAIDEDVLDTNQPFIFVDVDAAKKFIVDNLTKSEEFQAKVAAVEKVLAG